MRNVSMLCAFTVGYKFISCDFAQWHSFEQLPPWTFFPWLSLMQRQRFMVLRYFYNILFLTWILALHLLFRSGTTHTNNKIKLFFLHKLLKSFSRLSPKAYLLTQGTFQKHWHMTKQKTCQTLQILRITKNRHNWLNYS